MTEFLYTKDSPAVQMVERRIAAIKYTIYQADFDLDAHLAAANIRIKELEAVRDSLLLMQEETS